MPQLSFDFYSSQDATETQLTKRASEPTRDSSRYSMTIILAFIAIGASAASSSAPQPAIPKELGRSPAITGPATAEPVNPGENGAWYEADVGPSSSDSDGIQYTETRYKRR